MKRWSLGMLLILAVVAGQGLAQPPALPSFDPCTQDPCQRTCPVTSCPSVDPCPAGGSPRTWGSVDYLLWWLRKGGTPPLVVSGSSSDPFPGALDQPGTQVLFGNNGLNYHTFNGLRLNLGAWLDGDGCWGIEAGGFALERRSIRFAAHGDGNGQPFLAAPFISALSGFDNVYFISQNFADPAISGLLTGGVSVSSGSRLWSWEVNSVTNLAREAAWSFDLLAGFRQLSLREDLSYQIAASNLAVGGAAEFLGTTLPPGFTVASFDQFRTENLFNGGQLGARLDRSWGPVSLNLVGKLGLGAMHQGVMIQGQTTTNAPLPVTQAIGGIYAQASNIGNHDRNIFAVVPEADVNLGLNLTPSSRVRVGYTFLYVSSVVRPGDQIDPVLNTNRVPIDPNFGAPGGPNRPAVDVKGTGFWAQGINFGLEWMF